MKKLLSILLMVVMMIALVSCGSEETEATNPTEGENNSAPERISSEGLLEKVLNDDGSMTLIFTGEPYEKLVEEKENFDMSNTFGLDIGARLFDADDNELGVFYYGIFPDYDEAYYTLENGNFLRSTYGEGIDFELTEESVAITIVSDEIEDVYNQTTHAKITVSTQDFDVVYSQEVEF